MTFSLDPKQNHCKNIVFAGDAWEPMEKQKEHIGLAWNQLKTKGKP